MDRADEVRRMKDGGRSTKGGTREGRSEEGGAREAWRGVEVVWS